MEKHDVYTFRMQRWQLKRKDSTDEEINHFFYDLRLFQLIIIDLIC